ncbi:hypothetical protein [Leptothrix discophora]|uniref:Uncharacterized protein n=1 Tax=Leptothrix discophora TaxID=89 RepID=A0ABT9G1H8_LEPDI|nr:hypothetical protein [Leptothrix discophora]MDP4300344.1 hypothetical protein [Leptothrix discophora]
MTKTLPKADPAPDAAPDNSPDNSPDTTPIPGGGRWAWDDTAGAWVSRDKPADPATPSTPQQEP